MTEQEAIKILKGTHSLILQTNIRFEDCIDYKYASKVAIEALEKQIPKKPVPDGTYLDSPCFYHCPNCGGDDIVSEEFERMFSYCPDCGQKLDWSYFKDCTK